MQIHLGDDPFRMWIRREDGYEVLCSVRFEAEHGRAQLSLRIQGREDPDPVSHYEEDNIPAEAVRQGRFVHVLPGGNRRSYALSRLTQEMIEQLPGGRWVELEPLTEFGFRYIIFPKDLALADASATAAAKPAAPVAAAAAAPAGPAVAAPRPTAVSKASPPSAAPRAPAPARPPRQTPVAPELAHEALSQLSHQAAIQHLKMEMAKVEALHQRVDELERKLAASQERERDVLGILQKWQVMDY
ncbi:MAG: hypothetical protein R3F61_19115 [Myxococcota bacterium]